MKYLMTPQLCEIIKEFDMTFSLSEYEAAENLKIISYTSTTFSFKYTQTDKPFISHYQWAQYVHHIEILEQNNLHINSNFLLKLIFS